MRSRSSKDNPGIPEKTLMTSMTRSRRLKTRCLHCRILAHSGPYGRCFPCNPPHQPILFSSLRCRTTNW